MSTVAEITSFFLQCMVGLNNFTKVAVDGENFKGKKGQRSYWISQTKFREANSVCAIA